MRKILLLSVLVVAVMFSSAQWVHVANKLATMHKEVMSPVLQQNQNNWQSGHQLRSGRALASAGRLNSQRVGSAGNLLTAIEAACNQIDVNDSLNVVTFVHRNDPSIFQGTNVGQYRFDISKDRGDTWRNDIGLITNDSRIDNIAVNGRYPQGGIHNPAGNNIPDSAYLVYSGTWHNGDQGSWYGEMRGRGKLSGDTSTFNVHIDTINNGHVAIATGFCHGAPGVFWNVNRDYTGTFVTGSNALTNGIIVEKGVWNSTTKDVDWTSQTIPQVFVKDLDGSGAQFSIIFSLNIAFDPTGQYGWISCLGDITNDQDSVFDPIFWKTTNGGASWSSAIRVDLDSLQDVVSQLSPTNIINGGPSSGIPTAWTDADLVVDYLGNPHLVTIVGNGSGYGIEYARFDAWDITYNANAPSCAGGWNGWSGAYLDSVETLSGTMTSDATPFTENNRPLASRSGDGKRVFFFWTDSDFDLVQTPDNDVPNLFTRAFDLEHHTRTPVTNLTEGDTLWGGETFLTPGGVFGGAIYGTVSPVALKNGNSYNVPLVFTQIDYNHDPAQGLGKSDVPAAFWYINNIDFAFGDFSEGITAQVEIIGAQTVNLIAGQPYVESGATLTYLDTSCYQSGILHLVIDTTGFDPSTPGTYHIYYLAEDANGNIFASDSRVIIVGSAPIANFTWGFPGQPYVAHFEDQSAYSPTQWLWNFGDGTPASGAQSPVHTFTSNGTKNVCLTASNGFGTSAQVCKLVTITGVGIDEVDFAQQVKVFPNPSSGKVYLSLNSSEMPEFNVSVYNILGETLLSPAKYKAGTAKVEIDLSAVSNGIYLVKVQSKQGTMVKQLTVNK